MYDVGTKGVPGTKGNKGLKGSVGGPGPGGTKGVKGDQGAIGPKGIAGIYEQLSFPTFCIIWICLQFTAIHEVMLIISKIQY